MKLFLSQFRILFWKNWLLKKRHPYLTFLEIFLPLITSFMMVMTLASFDPKKSLKRGPLSRSYDEDRVIEFPKPVYNLSFDPKKSLKRGPLSRSYDEDRVIEFPKPVYNLRENLQMLHVMDVTLQYYYTPASNCAKRFVSEMHNEFQLHMNPKRFISYVELKNEWEMDAKFSQLENNHTVMVGLIFHNACNDDYKLFLKDFAVTIRALGPNTINFKARFPDKLVIGPSNQTFYVEMYGFLESQNFLSMAYLNEISRDIMKTKKKIRINNVIIYRYPFSSLSIAFHFRLLSAYSC